MSEDNYGLTIPEGIALRAKVLDKTADITDRQSAAEVLRLSFNERPPIPD